MTLRVRLPPPPEGHAYVPEAGLHAWRALRLTGLRSAVLRETSGSRMCLENENTLRKPDRAMRIQLLDGHEEWRIVAPFGPQQPYAFYYDFETHSEVPPLALEWEFVPSDVLLTPPWPAFGPPRPPVRLTLLCQLC